MPDPVKEVMMDPMRDGVDRFMQAAFGCDDDESLVQVFADGVMAVMLLARIWDIGFDEIANLVEQAEHVAVEAGDEIRAIHAARMKMN